MKLFLYMVLFFLSRDCIANVVVPPLPESIISIWFLSDLLGNTEKVDPYFIVEENFILFEKPAKAVLFNLEGWNDGVKSKQYLAVFFVNPKKNSEIEQDKKISDELSLISFIKVGDNRECNLSYLKANKGIITVGCEKLIENGSTIIWRNKKDLKFKIEPYGIRPLIKNG